MVYYFATVAGRGGSRRGVISSCRERVSSRLAVETSSSGGGGEEVGEIGEAGSVPECIEAMSGRVHPACIDILEADLGAAAEGVRRKRLDMLREHQGLVFRTPASRFLEEDVAAPPSSGAPPGQQELEEGEQDGLELRIGSVNREEWPSFEVEILRVGGDGESSKRVILTVPESLRPASMRAKSRVGCAAVATAVAAASSAPGRVKAVWISCPVTYRALAVQAPRWIRGLDSRTRKPESESVVDTRRALDAAGIEIRPAK